MLGFLFVEKGKLFIKKSSFEEFNLQSSNLVMYGTATPQPLLYCQNRSPPALQTIDDPTGKPPKQWEKVLCRQWIRASVMETVSPRTSLYLK